jgi:hypothetical protein
MALRTMKCTDFEQEMQSREYFHSLRFLPGVWVILPETMLISLARTEL